MTYCRTASRPVRCLPALLGLLLAGCISTGHAKLADPSVLEQIKVGETTREQVGQLLGEPDRRRSITMSGATYEHWIYRHSASVINPLEYLLLYGFLYNGLGAHDQDYMLDVAYGPTGLVATRHYQQTSYDLGSPMEPATVTSHAGVDSRPGQTGKPVHWEDKVVGRRPLGE